MTAASTTAIEIREPDETNVGCISARASEFGPELCYAVGREYGDWYISINDVVWSAAGLDPAPTHLAGGRRDAEHLVRLLAGLYDAAGAR